MTRTAVVCSVSASTLTFSLFLFFLPFHLIAFPYLVISLFRFSFSGIQLHTHGTRLGRRKGLRYTYPAVFYR
jgi:integral membrane sensor domain MASE1